MNPSLGEFCSYDNWKDVYKKYRCYADNNIIYGKFCNEETVEITTESGYHEASYNPASCAEDAGRGNSFGAGGGGGNASKTPNVDSKGGKGGYGAVVIEW